MFYFWGVAYLKLNKKKKKKREIIVVRRCQNNRDSRQNIHLDTDFFFRNN